MPIKRYTATADNTITNAFKEDLSTRATASNMGCSDVLELFSIYAQANTTSVEKSRILLDFPVSEIITDRASSDIPVSGNVKFFLKMSNVKHKQTLPKQFDVQILPLSRSWSEGTGLDMESYSDKGHSNWVSSRKTTDSFIAATAVASIDIAGTQTAAADVSFTINVPTVAGGSGTDVTVFIDISSDGTVAANANEIRIGADSQNDAAITDLVILGINGTDGNARVTLGSGLTSGVGVKGLTAADGADDTKINLTAGSTGYNGNKIELKNVSGVAVVKTDKLSGGLGGEEAWTTAGGDYHEVGYTAGQNLPHYKKYFEDGTEDLEVNITALVEEWIDVNSKTDPDRTNYGLLLKLSGSFEDGTRKDSFYTKKFFARSSEFFYKRPAIEARWRDFKGDDRENFYLSSSLVPGEDNLNTLYLYNYTRKGLVNIPALSTDSDGGDQAAGTPVIKIRLYNSASTGKSPITFPVGGGVTALMGANPDYAFGYLVEKGIYSASFAYTGSATSLYDVWCTLGNKEVVTGSSITVKTHNASFSSEDTELVTKITNLKSSYKTSEKVRMRVFSREKNKSPNLYDVSTRTTPVKVVENAYYRIFRVIDGLEVISYGSGSVGVQTQYSRLSYDKDGNYFDLNMSLFESGYQYAIELVFDIDGKHKVQDKTFKFRVD